MGAEEKREKTKIIRGALKIKSVRTNERGPDSQTPQAGTGDSVSRFRRYYCSTVINYNNYFPVGEQFYI